MLTKVQQIYERVADQLKDPNFRIRFIQRPEDFSRHRKWSFSSLMAMILNRVDPPHDRSGSASLLQDTSR